MKFQNVTIIGSGLMGSGIAYVVANSGRSVTMVDTEQQFLDKGMSSIRTQIKDGISRNKMSPFEGEKLSKRFTTSTNLEEAVKNADLVIEAAYENMEVKKEIFSKLSNFTNPETILVTNTSTLSITEIASVVDKPDRVLGLHFFSPVAAMKLVEVIYGEKTDEKFLGEMMEFGESIGKTPLKAKDAPGFIVNRLLVPSMNEALKLYDNGGASMEDIDKAMVIGANHPAGPFTLADYVGLDVTLASMQTLYDKLGDHYKPSETLVNLVKDGKLGMKTKEGFYKY